jgi:hypothetical protein
MVRFSPRISSHHLLQSESPLNDQDPQLHDVQRVWATEKKKTQKKLHGARGWAISS